MTTSTDDDVSPRYPRLTNEEFADLYLKSVATLKGYIYQFVHDHDLAEDLAQEAYLKAYRAGGSSRGFVFTIARNLAFDYLRRKRKVGFYPSSNYANASDYGEAHPNNGIEEVLEMMGLFEPEADEALLCQEAVDEWLAWAAPRDRPILQLIAEGYRLIDIATLLDMKYDTVKIRLHRIKLSARAERARDRTLVSDEKRLAS